MRVLRCLAALLSLPLACGCSPDRQSGKRTAAPSKAPAAIVAAPKKFESKLVSSQPKARSAGAALPSGLGLRISPDANSLGDDVNSINPVKVDAGATLAPAGGMPR